MTINQRVKSVRTLRQLFARGLGLRRGPAAMSRPQDDHATRLIEAALGDAAKVFRELPDPPPGYESELRRIRRDSELHAVSGSRHPYWSVNPKRAGYRFAAAHGVSHPELFGSFDSIDDVTYSE
ncbi:MAG: hypothetical protein GWN79_21720, partial [Actinobacteria bacterium]|nr:hypothetical protein [Actinomycetota bacterium]NIS35019.1 hypothetical protein [Actinomycetota bacterium]NIT98529.1 hypothetical protein [Actinomycetota bacterium]NIU21523.1 hypothetical protein [Actinomycetota bacterium]NIU69743.1 hypothetical protein [Actinomycetota bacterium]